MRDPDLLIKVLRETAQMESGVIKLVKPYDDNLWHHVNLLIEVGWGVERPDFAMEITNAGYDFLNALDANPNNEQKWLDLLKRGEPMASATLQVTSGFGI